MKYVLIMSMLLWELVLGSIKLAAQTTVAYSSSIDAVYANLINAIGNLSKTPPKLKIVDSKRFVAQYIPIKNIIELEISAWEVCKQTGPDSLNALSFILGHELCHYYNEHNWLASVGSKYIGTELGEKLAVTKTAIDTTIKYETEADEFSCFYSKLAGYSISKAPELLTNIYQSYGLPEHIDHYPSLSDRKAISQRVSKEIAEINRLFEFAVLLQLKGEDRCASILYRSILNKNFGSREIYNNLGVAYAMQGLQFADENLKKLVFPFSIDPLSRANASLSRGMDGIDSLKAASYFKNASEQFERARQLDKNHLPSILNIAMIAILKHEPEDASYYISKARKQFGNKEEINYAEALINYISGNPEGLKSIEQLAEKKLPQAVQTLSLIKEDDVASQQKEELVIQQNISALKMANRKINFKELPFKTSNDEGRASIFQRDTLGASLLLFEFVGPGGFNRSIQAIEINNRLLNNQDRENLRSMKTTAILKEGVIEIEKKNTRGIHSYLYSLNKELDKLILVY